MGYSNLWHHLTHPSSPTVMASEGQRSKISAKSSISQFFDYLINEKPYGTSRESDEDILRVSMRACVHAYVCACMRTRGKLTSCQRVRMEEERKKKSFFLQSDGFVSAIVT